MLQWRTRRRAEAVLDALYSPATKWQVPDALKGVSCESAGAGITLPKGAEPIPLNSLKHEDGLAALDYLRFCWSTNVYQQIVAAHVIPRKVLEQAWHRSEERREKIELSERILHNWEGRNLASDTAALCDVIVASKPKLYRIDKTLVRISDPVFDPATAERVRRLHG
jgi:hypothetical protein